MSYPHDPKVKAEIIRRLTNGERTGDLYKEYGVPVRTLRDWRKEATIAPWQDSSAPGEVVHIAVIPDVQAKPGTDFTYLSYVGRYIASKRPKHVICIGDFADMPSLSFHDAPGSKNFEGQRYKEDILATHIAMKTLMEPMRREMERGWNPQLILTLGNHENRIDRTISATPKLDGVMGLPDLEYERWGWRVIPFLEPVVIEGVAFCHYFCSGVMGRPITTARALLNKKHMSCFAGHQQGRDIAYGVRGDGKQMTAIIAGSCYEHDELYLNHQTNNHFRGIYILNDVEDGTFDEMAVSLKYLKRRYEM